MRNGKAWSVGAVLAASSLPWLPSRAYAARETDVPKVFVNGYVGGAFTSKTNRRFQHSGTNQAFSYTLNGMSLQNSPAFGLGMGYWFTQVPVSFGISGTMDFFPTAVKGQEFKQVPFERNGAVIGKFNFKTSNAKMFQFVPGFNVLLGVPLKFVRPYIGGGPGFFVASHTVENIDSAGNKVSEATTAGVGIGYNAFAGADVFISRRFSVFLEVKQSQVNNMKFEYLSTLGGTNTYTYDKLIGRRLAVGGSLHF